MANVVTFTDNFNRPDDGDITTSPNWTTPEAGPVSAEVVSNQVHITGGTDRIYLCPDQGSSNHYTQIARVSGANHQYFDCIVRATDGQNFIGARIQSNVLELWRRVGGALTQFGSFGHAPLVTDVIRVEANSSNEISVYLDNILRIGPVVITEHSTATRQGFNTRNEIGTPAIDDFEAGIINGRDKSLINSPVSQTIISGVIRSAVRP